MRLQRSAEGEGTAAEFRTGTGSLVEAQRRLVAEEGASGLWPGQCAGRGKGGWEWAEARWKAPAHHSEESGFYPQGSGSRPSTDSEGPERGAQAVLDTEGVRAQKGLRNQKRRPRSSARAGLRKG